MDDANYPVGTGRSWYTRWMGGIQKYFRKSDASEFIAIDGTNRRMIAAGIPISKRIRLSLAQVNAGATLVAAIPGYSLRVLDMAVIAIGGAAAAGTAVVIQAVQAASTVSLLSVAQAQLTQGAVNYPGLAGSTVLADGASFVANDAGTAITAAKTGSSFTTAVSFDFLLTYVVD